MPCNFLLWQERCIRLAMDCIRSEGKAYKITDGFKIYCS